MISSLLHLVGLRPRVYYTLTNFRGGGGARPPWPPPLNTPMAYISLIRPDLEYSCSVWHPHKKSNKEKVEKVQRIVAPFVSNNFKRKASVSEMLHNLGWQSLDSRRQDQQLVLFYKIINRLASTVTFPLL